MKKIILIDNDEEHISLLTNLLNEGYDSFINKFNALNGAVRLSLENKPVIKGYHYIDSNNIIDVDDAGTKIDKKTFIEEYVGDNDLCFIDLCLTVEEHIAFNDGQMGLPNYEELTGFKFAKEIQPQTRVFVMSMFFLSVKLPCFSPLVVKPVFQNIDKEWAITRAPRDGNYYTADLPELLYTDKPDEAFCNIIFYKFFNSN